MDTEIWTGKHAGEYESSNYGKGLSGFVMRSSHRLIEKDFRQNVHFGRVLEVGSGPGVHLGFVQHGFDEYYITDMSPDMLEHARQKNKNYAAAGDIVYRTEDATRLSFADNSFDRLVASHVLEHLYRPHEVLAEWLRVLRPGGTLSIVLPCDPGAMWRLGRCFGPRSSGIKRGLPYDYVMALEHVNPITNLVAIIRHMFEERQEKWWPLRIASTDLNLIYTVNIIVGKRQ
jgi:ubiquinone/menaquinone biosynthesis C-methylase UbiE